MKILTFLLIFGIIWGQPGIVTTATTPENAPPPVEAATHKTYFLVALPNGSRRSIQLDPPAMRLVITSDSGDTAIRCGDGFQSYNCSPGKRLELSATDQPFQTIWAENGSATQVRLKINVLEEFDPNEDISSIGGLAGCQLIRPARRLWESVFGGTAQNIVHCG